MLFLFRISGTVIKKTSAQLSDHTCFQSTDNFNFCRWMSLPQNGAKRHYRYHSITASCLPSPRYYREISPTPAVITVVTSVLPLPPSLCHPLLSTMSR